MEPTTTAPAEAPAALSTLRPHPPVEVVELTGRTESESAEESPAEAEPAAEESALSR